MDKRLSDFDKVMSCLLEPLGDYAPKRRYLLLDYNDSSGADLHHEALQYVPRGDRQGLGTALLGGSGPAGLPAEFHM